MMTLVSNLRDGVFLFREPGATTVAANYLRNHSVAAAGNDRLHHDDAARLPHIQPPTEPSSPHSPSRHRQVQHHSPQGLRSRRSYRRFRWSTGRSRGRRKDLWPSHRSSHAFSEWPVGYRKVSRLNRGQQYAIYRVWWIIPTTIRGLLTSQNIIKYHVSRRYHIIYHDPRRYHVKYHEPRRYQARYHCQKYHVRYHVQRRYQLNMRCQEDITLDITFQEDIKRLFYRRCLN